MFDKFKKAMQKESDKLDKARDEKCIPLAKQYLRILIKHNPSLDGQLKEKELNSEYEPMVLELLDLYLQNNITIIEHGYVKKLVLEMVNNFDSLLSMSVNSSFDQANKKLWGVDKEYITFSKIDEVLTGKTNTTTNKDKVEE